VTPTAVDKAGRSYWERYWEDREPALPAAVDPRLPGWDNYLNRRFDELYKRVLPSGSEGMRFLEVGCGRSTWLPYFAREFGLAVDGIDYSDLGARQAARILESEGVQGEIVCADFFSPPPGMRLSYDIVWSLGVVEHFADTSLALSALAEFLKPGGLLLTVIPNLAGVLGPIQKLINRPVYDVHVPLDRDALAAAHEEVGFEVSWCDYFLFASLDVNIENWRGSRIHPVAVRLRSWITKGLWIAERMIPALRQNRWSSPYVVCVARKPAHAGDRPAPS
jgi:SAM-dependent methyltransferase